MRKALLLLSLTLLLAACGGNTPSNNTNDSNNSNNNQSASAAGPAEAASAWYEAYFAGNGDGVLALTCNAQREMTETTVGSIPTQPEGVTIDVSGVTFEVSDQTDTTATVTASGSVAVTVAGQTVEQSLDSEGLAAPLTMVLEDGTWKVC